MLDGLRGFEIRAQFRLVHEEVEHDLAVLGDLGVQRLDLAQEGVLG